MNHMPNTKSKKTDKKTILFNAKGVVLGNYWGGGEGSYPSRKLDNFKSKKELLDEAKKLLKSGALDSGMGYESLIGAILEIEKVSTIKINNKTYTNTEYYIESIGNLTEDQSTFLISSLSCV